MARKFDVLKDVPHTKVGQAGKLVTVKDDETALEYSTNPWLDLIASKLDLVGKAGKFLRVNEAGDGLIFDDYEVMLYDDPVPIGNGVSWLKSNVDTGFRLADIVDIEFWYYYADTQNWGDTIGLFEIHNDNANWLKMGISNNSTIAWIDGKVNNVAMGGFNMIGFFNTVPGWYHIRLCWDDTTFKVWRNGSLFAVYTVQNLNSMVGVGATLYLYNTYAGDLPIPEGHSLIHFRYIRNEFITSHYPICEESGNTIYNAITNAKHLTGQDGFDSIVWSRINDQFRHLGNYGYRKSGNIFIPGLLTGNGAADGNPLTFLPRAVGNEFKYDDLYGFLDMGIAYQGYITLDNLPDITGTKTIKFKLFLDHDGGYFGGTWGHVLFYFSDGIDSSDWLYVSLYGDILRVYVTDNDNVSSKYISLAGLYGQELAISINKTAGSISSITINDVAQVLTNLSGLASGSATKKIHIGTSGSTGRFKLWNFSIENNGNPTLNMVGHPAGNTDAAWVDTIGGNNGTVSSTGYLTHISN